MIEKLKYYVDSFNKTDNQLYSQLFPNDKAFDFLKEQIPLIDCPDKDIEKTYYYRWWTYRKHIKDTPHGHIITEFLPKVAWSGPYNSINCPAGFHIREGRWLKDQDNWIKEYINFWLNGIGKSPYSSWYAHAVLEYCALKNDYDFAIEVLPKLIKMFEDREKKQKRNGGLYWSLDGYDGMELSISGSGLRPTLNSYVYGDAIAIAKIAKIAKNFVTEQRFLKIAEEIKTAFDSLLWDKDFYKVLPLGETEENPYTQRPKIPCEHDVREELGFIPWYFNLPDNDKCVAFKQLLDHNGFKAKYGITSAERRHKRYLEEHPHECLWNGPVWPFATSQTLVAIANAIRNYTQDYITKDDYFDLLLQYAKSHKRTLDNGKVIPWIDENLHPDTCVWEARRKLEAKGWLKEKGGLERGKDYNHSLFCDLVLSGLFGIDVKDGKVTVNPLVPDSWDYFKVENLWLCGKRYRITYTKAKTVIENY
ncbi:MAG: hypothetical protein E7537_04320 [Ruminococcaceae bacterium]|nr:hypothetical protein [Oscillospiraceae bacterium]